MCGIIEAGLVFNKEMKMIELTVTMRIDADEYGVSAYACNVTGENIPVNLIVHIDEVLQTDLDEGYLEELPTNRFFNAKNSFEFEGDWSVGLAYAWVSVCKWAMMDRLDQIEEDENKK